MSVLTIPTFGDVSIAKGGAQEESERVGDFAPSLSGKMRSDSIGRRDVWQFATVEYPIADCRTIRGILLGTLPITVSGDAIGGSVAVHPRQVRITPVSDGADLLGVVSFDLHRTTPV